ncbi:MAG: alpha/beta hydrolase [Tepidiformaceae bacterium]
MVRHSTGAEEEMPHVTVNGARLWYEVRGAGEPILLHHGYTASRVNWMPVAERLESRYQVILMECRGTGESEHTADGYSLEQYAADVIGVADHLGLESFTYAGHSMGGGIGYVLALTYPKRIKRLILMAPVPADGIPGDAPLPTQPTEHDRETLLARYTTMRFRPEVETDAWFEDRVRHVLSVSNGHYVGGAAAMRGLHVGDRLGELTMPALMIAGAADGLLPANLKDFARLPNATLEVFSRAGHEVAIHEPDGVAKAIDGFMKHGVVTAKTLQARLAAATNR